MPQLEKGGKYVFGWSLIRPDGRVPIPEEVCQEYGLKAGDRVILISGSRTTGGLCVATKTRIEQSPLVDILVHRPELAAYEIEAGATVRYKGRQYGWTTVETDGSLVLHPQLLTTFAVSLGDYLLSIRGSNIAFVLGLKGPIIEIARRHPEISVFG
jgi:hypothetical protein